MKITSKFVNFKAYHFLATTCEFDNRLKQIFFIFLTFLSTISIAKKLPKPTGSYNVGITYRTIKTERVVKFGLQTDSLRTIYLKIWYPAKKSKEYFSSPYIEDLRKLLDTKSTKLTRATLKKSTDVRTNSFLEVPIAEGTFPLVTYSHGLDGYSSDNTILMEELASHGFIVASISHHFQSFITSVSSDSILVVPFSSSRTKKEEEENIALHSRLDSVKSQEEYNLFCKKWNAIEMAEAIEQEIWIEDILNTIAFFKQKNDSLTRHVDTTKIATIGFSFGGSSAINATMVDTSITSVINLDGFIWGQRLLKKSTRANVLLLTHSIVKNKEFSSYGNYLNNNGKPYATLMFKKTKHANFTDLNHLPAIDKSILGTVKNKFLGAQIRYIVVDFLSKTLNNEPIDFSAYEVNNKVYLYNY